MDHDQRTSIKKNIPNNTDTTQDTITQSCPKVNSVRFEDLYEHINPMENSHEYTHIIDTQEQEI